MENFGILTPGDPNFDLSQNMTEMISKWFFASFRTLPFVFSLRRPGAEIMGGGAFKRPPPPAGGGKSRGPAGRGLTGLSASEGGHNCFGGRHYYFREQHNRFVGWHIPLDGGIIASEGGIILPEGVLVASEGGIIPSEGGIIVSEGGIVHSEGGIIASEVDIISPRSPLSGCLYRDVTCGTESLYPIQIPTLEYGWTLQGPSAVSIHETYEISAS